MLILFILCIKYDIIKPVKAGKIKNYIHIQHRERIDKIDNIKGFLIWLVVIGHFMLPKLNDQSSELYINFFYFLYAFHMPAFMIVSGYLAKKNNFYQLFKYALIYIVFKRILGVTEHLAYNMPSFFPDFFHESGAPWYLICLIVYKIIIMGIDGIWLSVTNIINYVITNIKNATKSDEQIKKEALDRAIIVKEKEDTKKKFLEERSYEYIEKKLSGEISSYEDKQNNKIVTPVQELAIIQKMRANNKTDNILYNNNGKKLNHSFLSLLKNYVLDVNIARIKNFGIFIKKIYPWALFIASFALSLKLGYLKNVGDFLSLDRVIAFAPFFFFGYAYRGNIITGKTKGKEKILEWFFRIIFVMYVAFMIKYFYKYLMDTQLVFYGAWYERTHDMLAHYNISNIDAIARGVWIILAIIVSFGCYACMPNKKVPILTISGKYSIAIYIIHRVVRDLCIYYGLYG